MYVCLRAYICVCVCVCHPPETSNGLQILIVMIQSGFLLGLLLFELLLLNFFRVIPTVSVVGISRESER